MIPDASLYNPDPAYLRSLIERTGLSQRQCAFCIGIGERSMRQYLATSGRQDACPYPVQFALECLARMASAQSRAVIGLS
jgi:hypothetical protein